MLSKLAAFSRNDRALRRAGRVNNTDVKGRLETIKGYHTQRLSDWGIRPVCGAGMFE